MKRQILAALFVATAGLTLAACSSEPSQGTVRPVVERIEHDETGWQPFRDVRGHTGCEINAGETSKIRCADGWTDES